MAEKKETKKTLEIDAEACIGCGTCESIAPDYFKIVDGVSEVIKEYNENDAEDIEEAINNCPVQAILLRSSKKDK